MISCHLTQFLVIICVSVGPVGNAAAQHLPEEQRAKGPPEHVLSGINVYKTLLTDAVRRLGQPTNIKIMTDEPKSGKAPSSGDVFYIWEKDGIRLRGATMYYERDGKRIESEFYSVDVWGVRPTQDGVGITGAGLALGDTIDKVVKCYGDRFFKDRTTKGMVFLQLQWTDETVLTVDFDRSGRIVHMQLTANIE
jgi:hypothetical protein